VKLSEVRPFLDRAVSDVGYIDPAQLREHVRRALAEAFMAGVRSQGLRYIKDTKLWEACGCVPAEEAGK
jgi:hypothetical protein